MIVCSNRRGVRISDARFFRQNRRILTAVLAVVGLAAPALAQVVREEMWPMRDGVALRTVLVLPLSRDPHPTVLLRSPYCFSADDLAGIGTLLNRRGYAFVSQQVRGICGSEGQYAMYATDGWGVLQDGVDTVNIIVGLPWSDGQVGTWGYSALGIASELLGGAGSPYVKASVNIVAANDMYSQATFRGGEFLKDMVEGWVHDQGADDLLSVIIANPSYNEFWEQTNVFTRADYITAPTLFMGGWYDIFQAGTMDGFLFRNHDVQPPAVGNCRLMIGPWTHLGFAQQQQGELVYPRNAAAVRDTIDVMMDFFDAMLLGLDVDLGPPVQYYTMGDVDDRRAPGNEWRYADDWPPAPLTTVPLYLRADGRLTAEPPVEVEPAVPFSSDPANPVPTLGGANLYLPAGPFDQRSIEARPDVLVFETDPLVDPLEITGRVTARLFVSSDALDFDVCVRVCDVYPDGRSMLLLDGVRKARYRYGFTEERLMDEEPDGVAEIEVDLWHTSIVLNTGHRLRISISGSNYPRFDVNPNTGEPFRQHTHTQIAHNAIQISPQYPSALLVPIPE